MDLGMMLSVLGAVIASTVSGLGAAIGVGIAGAAANGLLSEEPEKFGNTLLLVALPGTQGIYGFVCGVVILIILGFFGGGLKAPTVTQGIAILGVGIFISLVEWISSIHQGKVCAAGIAIVAKNPEHTAKGLVNGVMVETYAVLGLLISLLTLFFVIAPHLQ